VFFGLQNPDKDPLVRGIDPDPDPALDPDPDPSIIMKKYFQKPSIILVYDSSKSNKQKKCS
jgi:hypothetical protein